MKLPIRSLMCLLSFFPFFCSLQAEFPEFPKLPEFNDPTTFITQESSITTTNVDTFQNLTYDELLRQAGTLAETKNYTESIALYERAIAREPKRIEALFNCGVMHMRLSPSNSIQALSYFERVLELEPNRVEALFNCGIIHLKLTPADNAKALSYFDRAIIVAPTHAKSLRYRAKCLADLGKKEEALVAYEKALHYNTSSADIYNEYAQLCSDNAQYLRAAELYEHAYRLNPRDQTILSLGNAYNMINDLDKALSWYKRLEAKNPSSPAVLYNIAYTFKKLGRVDEAFPYYRKVLALEPGHAEAHFGLGLSYLITGDFENGFREYEYRWGRDKKTKRSPKSPEWDGCSLLEGKTFLLIAEQGLGDTFQFIRFGQVLREQYGAAHVIAAVQKPLVQLLSLCPYLDKVVAINEPLPVHDYHAHTVSMPYLCKITRETVPTPIPYIFADEKLVEFWHEKLAADKNFKIGICWQGNPNYSTQFLRSVVAAKSITLTKLLPLFAVKGVSFYNLQKMTGEEQLKLLPEGTPLISFGEDFDKDHGRFMDTAAVMKNLDLMITVDTGTAHISAALGVPTWTFIPEPPDWRWMLKCTDTPWYPNMRLFRQPAIGDWETTIALVCHELEALVREQQDNV